MAAVATRRVRVSGLRSAAPLTLALRLEPTAGFALKPAARRSRLTRAFPLAANRLTCGETERWAREAGGTANRCLATERWAWKEGRATARGIAGLPAK